jgi:hypothetical protein
MIGIISKRFGDDPKGSRVQGFWDPSEILGPFLQFNWRRNNNLEI